MSVLNVTLLAIGIVLLIVLSTIPLIFFMKGLDAWRNIPREIYASRQQRLFGLRPTSYWVVACLLSQGSRLLEWKGWHGARQIAENVSLLMIALVLAYQLVWAMRIVQARAEVDVRLVRFARYALWGSAVYFLAAAACLVGNLTPQ